MKISEALYCYLNGQGVWYISQLVYTSLEEATADLEKKIKEPMKIVWPAVKNSDGFYEV